MPGRRRHQPADHAQQRRLAGSVRAEQRHHRPARDGEVDAAQHLDPAVRGVDVDQFEDRRGPRRVRPSWLAHQAVRPTVGARSAWRCRRRWRVSPRLRRRRAPERLGVDVVGEAEVGGLDGAGRRGSRPGVPGAITLPNSSTWIRSHTPMTRSMSCSTISTARPSAGESLQQHAERLGLGLVQARGRLVEQQQLRLDRQRARHLEQPGDAGGHRVGALLDVALQPDRLDQLVDLRVACASRTTPRGAGVDLAGHLDVLAHGQRPERLEALEGARHAHLGPVVHRSPW